MSNTSDGDGNELQSGEQVVTQVKIRSFKNGIGLLDTDKETTREEIMNLMKETLPEDKYKAIDCIDKCLDRQMWMVTFKSDVNAVDLLERGFYLNHEKIDCVNSEEPIEEKVVSNERPVFTWKPRDKLDFVSLRILYAPLDVNPNVIKEYFKERGCASSMRGDSYIVSITNEMMPGEENSHIRSGNLLVKMKGPEGLKKKVEKTTGYHFLDGYKVIISLRGDERCRICSQEGHNHFKCPRKGEESLKVCRNCLGKGHFAHKCPKILGKVKCFNCEEFGHYSKDCKNEKKVCCFLCKEEGHMIKDCDERNKDMTCFRCGLMGHSKTECTNLPKERPCYNCDKVGHLAGSCPEVTDSRRRPFPVENKVKPSNGLKDLKEPTTDDLTNLEELNLEKVAENVNTELTTNSIETNSNENTGGKMLPIVASSLPVTPLVTLENEDEEMNEETNKNKRTRGSTTSTPNSSLQEHKHAKGDQSGTSIEEVDSSRNESAMEESLNNKTNDTANLSLSATAEELESCLEKETTLSPSAATSGRQQSSNKKLVLKIEHPPQWGDDNKKFKQAYETRRQDGHLLWTFEKWFYFEKEIAQGQIKVNDKIYNFVNGCLQGDDKKKESDFSEIISCLLKKKLCIKV